MVCVFKNCCCCIDLRTGSFIIGYLGLVGSGIMTLLLIIELIFTGESLTKRLEDERITSREWKLVGVSLSTIVLVFEVLSVIFSILLLIGLHKYKRGHVKAYLIYTAILIGISFIIFIAHIIIGSLAHNIVIDLLILGFSIYFFLVIRSYYLKMGVKHTVAPNGA